MRLSLYTVLYVFVVVFAFGYLQYLQHRVFDALCTFHKLIRFLGDFSNIFHCQLFVYFGFFFQLYECVWHATCMRASLL